MSERDVDGAHRKKMAALKQAQREKVRLRKAAEGGLLLVYTGDGKGKSTAALGTVVRALGWGHTVAIVQYVKGTWKVGEREFFSRHRERLTWFTMGEGFTWETQDRKRDIAAAQAAWETSLQVMRSGDYDLVVLDELNIVLRDNYLDVQDVVQGLGERASRTSVIVTGRDAKEELLQQADLVSEVKAVRHPFDNGIKAKKGIDF